MKLHEIAGSGFSGRRWDDVGCIWSLKGHTISCDFNVLKLLSPADNSECKEAKIDLERPG